MKDGLHGQDFSSVSAITAAVKQWISSTDVDVCEHGMQALVFTADTIWLIVVIVLKIAFYCYEFALSSSTNVLF